MTVQSCPFSRWAPCDVKVLACFTSPGLSHSLFVIIGDGGNHSFAKNINNSTYNLAGDGNVHVSVTKQYM